MLVAIEVEPDIELILAAHYLVEAGNVLIEVLYSGQAIGNAAVGRRLVEREILRQRHGHRTDRNLVVRERLSGGRVVDLDHLPLRIHRRVRSQVI